jgi:spore coat polysaccharide biosynthesis protein SpsF (cytidylyltransferase family)
VIDELLKLLQDRAKAYVRDRVAELMRDYPKSWKRYCAAYVCKHGSVRVMINTHNDYDEEREELWSVVVDRHPIPFRTKGEATAYAVQLLLEGLASRINYRKPRDWG